jgi:phosphocarrier protein HPr
LPVQPETQRFIERSQVVVFRDVVFRDRYGLHPRAAHRVQQALSGTAAHVTLEDLAGGGAPIDARSMLALISSGIQSGDRVRVTVEGTDEEPVLAAIAALLETGVCHP